MDLRSVSVLMKKATNKINGTNTELVPEQRADGFFHCWEHYKDEYISCVYGIIELESNGQIIKKEPHEIQFKTQQQILDEAIRRVMETK